MQLRRRSSPATLILILTMAGLLAGPAPEAGAARYAVAQCGWKVGNDGNWLETANDKFNRSSWCGVPPGSDPWDGVHITSGTRGSTDFVAGTKFARWRWNAPPGTGIVTVNGARWQVLKDNFQHRLGSALPGGSFNSFAEFSSTDTNKREFNRAFSPHAAAFESRLLCARPSGRNCSVTGTSLAGVRGMTITLEDPVRPVSTLSGAFSSGGWLRGSPGFPVEQYRYRFRAALQRDRGRRFGQGEHRARLRHRPDRRAVARHQDAALPHRSRGQPFDRHQPAERRPASGHRLRDRLRRAAVAVRLWRLCAPTTTRRRRLGVSVVVGGDHWRKAGPFELKWTNPDQGVAAPIAGVRYRITGPGSYDSGVVATGAADGLTGLNVPSAGSYRVAVWLVDAAGNENPAATAEATLRFDDVDPVAFLLHPEEETPELLRATVSDEHSGPGRRGHLLPPSGRGRSGGTCRPGSKPTVRPPRSARPSLPTTCRPGRYDIRTRVRDAAGNESVSDRRPDGTRLVLKAPLKDETRLDARLVGSRVSGRSIEVPFGEPVKLRGRLTGERGRGVAGVSGLGGPASGVRLEVEPERPAG